MISLIDPSREVARTDVEVLFAYARNAAIEGAMSPEAWSRFAGEYRFRDEPGWVYTQGAATFAWFRWEGEAWRDARAVPEAFRLLAPVRAFAATHRVAAGGAQSFTAPSADATGAVLAAGVELMLMEARGTWGCVIASNGWCGWVDGRALDAIEPITAFAEEAVPIPAAAPAPAGFVPTHTLDRDLPAWTTPDPSLAPVATLGAHLPVRVVERLGDWARIECDNGWSGWVDGRILP